MDANAKITSRYDAYQDVHELYVREGERKMMVLASKKDGKIEFCYYNIKKWEYPFHEDTLTEQDRARLVTTILNHYAAQGWHVDIDCRRFCPRCYEKLAGSDCDEWLGGMCDFCCEEIDRFGNIVF